VVETDFNEYAGQWGSFEGNQLISHGKDHLKDYQAAGASGHPGALLELVKANDALPSISG
jgi:hypothetical protein